jgi:hypothetical protein
MKKKILIHFGGNRKYRSIVRNLTKTNLSNTDFVIDNVHGKIFDLSYAQKPDMCIFTLDEYTQEIHNYIEANNKNTNIILYIESEIANQDLLKFFSYTNCRYICKKEFANKFKNSLSFDLIYDDTIFYPIKESARNGKIAISLSKDLDLNTNALKDLLYPNVPDHKIVLFNNPLFQHPQNVGIYNEPDLNYILNTFSYFVDMDEEFLLEATATDINILDKQNIMDNINNKNFNIQYKQNINEYKCTDILTNKIVPYLGIS